MCCYLFLWKGKTLMFLCVFSALSQYPIPFICIRQEKWNKIYWMHFYFLSVECRWLISLDLHDLLVYLIFSITCNVHYRGIVWCLVSKERLLWHAILKHSQSICINSKIMVFCEGRKLNFYKHVYLYKYLTKLFTSP